MPMIYTRRDAIALGAGASFLPWLAAKADQHKPQRSCIVLWMNGGPSQIDTLDPKPDHVNGGPFKPVQTSVRGIQLGEHLPQVAKQMKHLALVRSMATREGDHGRATQHLRTGNLPQGAIDFPVFGSLIAKEKGRVESDLPNFISISPRFGPASLSAGFLGPKFAPLVVGGTGGEELFGDDNSALAVENLSLPSGIMKSRAEERRQLQAELEAEFLQSRSGTATASHQSAYQQAARLMRESAAQAFDLTQEKAALRDRYGKTRFGQGCLLARRLVERGVPFVEVTLGGWDTHDNNFGQVKRLCETLDPAWATLMSDLQDRGLLETTTVVWMGEFGRTPVINPRNGRDHFPLAWSVALGGGGIKGGQVYGQTSPNGMSVADKPVSVTDLLATICEAIKVDPAKQNLSNVNRPIRVVDQSGKPIREVLS